MNLFKPTYYNMKKDLSQRVIALQKEKIKSKLRKVALDTGLPTNLRAIAVERLSDADVCEAVLMEYAGKDPCQKVYSEGAYHAAAETLGDPSRLERILRECGNWDMKAIIVSHLDDPALLEDLAINEGEKWGDDPYYTKVIRAAVRQIKDDDALIRVAIRGDRDAAVTAAECVCYSESCAEIALTSPHIRAKIKAVERMPDPSALVGPLRERLLPGILEDPTNETLPIKLLALCGDDLAGLLLYCTDNDQMNKWRIEHNKGFFNLEEAVVSKVDPDELYPALKRIYDSHAHHTLGFHGRDSLRNVSRCTQAMHKNGILAEQIEAEFPPTLNVHCTDVSYYGDGYEKSYDYEDDEIMEFWHRED